MDLILASAPTCCAFLIEMAAAIAAAHAELADEFQNCEQPDCYHLETYRVPHYPEPRERPNTTKLFADIVAACCRGEDPDELPQSNQVHQDGGGALPDYTIEYIIPWFFLPKLLPGRQVPAPGTLPLPVKVPLPGIAA